MTDEEAIRLAMQGKIIRCCSECVYYSKRKHKCQLGHYKESNPRDRFFADCGLEDIEKHDDEVRAKAIDEFYNDLADELSWMLDTNALFVCARSEIYNMIWASVAKTQEKIKGAEK